MNSTRIEPAAGRPVVPRSQEKWILAATIIASTMAFSDMTIVNVALPVLQQNLGASFAEVQWVVESYTLVLSALILVGGAIAIAMPVVADQRPMASPWRSRGKLAETMARLPGIIKAAPSPCTPRAITRVAGSGARPQAAEAAAKIAMPMLNTRRRP